MNAIQPCTATLRYLMGIVVLGVLICSPAGAQETSLFHSPSAVSRPNQTPPSVAGDNPAAALPAPVNPTAPIGETPNAQPGNGGVQQAYPYNPRFQQTPGFGLSAASWTYAPPPQPRLFRVHDIISIRVDEQARMQADGAADNRKIAFYDALLRDWVGLHSGRLTAAAQRDGDPRVNGQLRSQYRADGQISSRESMAFNIAAEIVDIRPNGNLVLEARKSIWHNDNKWETSLVGLCRSHDIGPDNVVLSRDMVDLQVRKQDKGRLRDATKRGWVTEWFERLQPF